MSPLARRRTRAVLAPPLLALAAAWSVLAPASAHDALGGTVPVAGSTVTVAPTEVTLTFAESPMTQGLGLAVTGPDGSSVTTGTPTVRVNVVSQRLVALTRSGTYTVAYRVVSSDGHPVAGTYSFVLALPTGATATTAAVPSPSAPSTAPAPVEQEGDGTGSGIGPWVVGSLLVVAAALGVVLTRRRRA